MLRWNEILLELVARADLPPAPSPDDTYPVPDANNPFADPKFPFGNPPYAARAYSYVAVAQFEALKVAADIVNERQAEPPSTSSALMERELAEVKEHGRRVGGYTVRFARLDGADRGREARTRR